MREVACRALGVLLKAARQRGIDPAILTADLAYDIEHLRDPKQRIEWDAFCQVLKNARGAWSLEELSDLNEELILSPFFSSVGVVARMLFTSRDLFDWICKHSVGGAAQLFSNCVTATHYQHLGEEITVIHLEVHEPWRPSVEFFWMTRGAFIAMPRLVGAGNAAVEMMIDGRRATYRVRYRNKRGTISSAVRLASLPFTARAAARELKQANEDLQTRFLELEQANERVARQARQLRTAHRVNELIRGDLDLDRTIEAIARALVEEAGFRRVELRVDDGRVVTLGDASATAPAITIELGAHRGRTVGELVVVPRADAVRDEVDEQLAFVVPSIAMALENALAYDALEVYRTELERLVEQRTVELRHTVEQLREAQGARERFFGNISHEIRTPLTVIMLTASHIESRLGATLDARSKKGLGVVGESARKLVRLVDELLMLAAGQEGKLRVEPIATDVAAIARDVTAAWMPAAELAGLELVHDVPPECVAKVDAVAFERITSNLVSNAVKYTPRGGRVVVQIAAERAAFRLSVLDNGIGFDEELASRLFGRFERGRGETARLMGTGLGLALCKQLVEAHGGTIKAQRRDVGSEVRVVMPRQPGTAVIGQAQMPARAVPASPRDLLEPGSRLGPTDRAPLGLVLVVEDDVALADAMAHTLAGELDVIVAHDGAAAVQLLALHQPQLLVTDVDLPNLDGIALAGRFRELAGDRLAPIIMVSASADLGTRIAGLEAGAIDFMIKPFEARELLARVRSQFRMRELAVRLHRAEQITSLGMLTSGLAHELRNPANGVINALRPLVRMLPQELLVAEHPVAQLLEVLHGCAEQIGVLSRQLLGVRNGGVEPVRREANARELALRAVQLAQAAYPDVQIRADLATDAVVQCAPPLLVQVLSNLLENAVHAVSPGGWIELVLQVELSLGEPRVWFIVSDSGPGVPHELRDRIFEPFFTTKPAGTGTGLGLSLAREIVQHHDGALELRQRAGRHAFVVDLPLSDVKLATSRVVPTGSDSRP